MNRRRLLKTPEEILEEMKKRNESKTKELERIKMQEIKEKHLNEQIEILEKDRIDYPLPEYTWIYKGIECKIKRNKDFYTWNGYIKLPENHPDIDEDLTELNNYYCPHGEFTYYSGDYLGFDTMHLNDFHGYRINIDKEWYSKLYINSTYKTHEWVKQETERLADIANKRHWEYVN